LPELRPERSVYTNFTIRAEFYPGGFAPALFINFLGLIQFNKFYTNLKTFIKHGIKKGIRSNESPF
jgi:hypothetical protein